MSPTLEIQGFPDGSDVKESACNVGDLGSTPVLGRSLGEGNAYSLHNSCLETSMDREAWQATVHGVTKSQTQLSNLHFHFSLSTTGLPGNKFHTVWVLY